MKNERITSNIIDRHIIGLLIFCGTIVIIGNILSEL